jgi:hypothetical protein
LRNFAEDDVRFESTGVEPLAFGFVPAKRAVPRVRILREGELPHFRARNAIRVRRVALKAYPARARR